jgi:hypothetical protein
MPFLARNFPTRNVMGARKASSSPFSGPQFGSVSDDAPSGPSTHGPDSNPASSTTPSATAIPNQSGDLAPGEVDHGHDALTASGSGSGAADSGSADASSLDDDTATVGGNVEGTQSTKAVDPSLNQDILDSVAAAVVAEASEDTVDFDRVAQLASVGQGLSEGGDAGVDLSGLL